MKNLQDNIVSSSFTIREAINQMDKNGEGFVLISDESNKVKAILTDGDFRRAVLKGVSVKSNCLSIANKNFIYLEHNYELRDAINYFLGKKVRLIPVLKNGVLISILNERDFNLAGKVVLSENKSEITVVIMAGGKGTRMKPFTNVLPKPLIPIGEQTILEVIMDRYNLYFKCDFYISVNYKANLIKAYLNEYIDKYRISYIEEDMPLGTGGSLKSLDGKIKAPFFVSNCDILIKANYQEIYNYHVATNNDLTIIASMSHYKVPYGVCEIMNGGELKALVEKPEYDFLVNAGMYIVTPETLKLIPTNKFYNITELINAIKSDGGKVGVFPVSEKSYLDSGQWKEYGDMLDALKD